MIAPLDRTVLSTASAANLAAVMAPAAIAAASMAPAANVAAVMAPELTTVLSMASAANLAAVIAPAAIAPASMALSAMASASMAPVAIDAAVMESSGRPPAATRGLSTPAWSIASVSRLPRHIIDPGSRMVPRVEPYIRLSTRRPVAAAVSSMACTPAARLAT